MQFMKVQKLLMDMMETMAIKLSKGLEWGKEDDKKLKTINDMVNILNKLAPQGDEKEVKRVAPSKEDKAIIEKFLAKNAPKEPVKKAAKPAAKTAARKKQ
jgi:hypothetical protein